MNDHNTAHRGMDVIVLLAAMTMLAPFAIDAYLPAFPQMMADFAATPTDIQRTLSLFLLGFSLGPLITGPISDALGRRVVILTGLLVFFIFTLACAVTTSVEWLVVFRFFQAAGGSSSLVAGRALLADVYRGDDLARKNSVISMFMAFGPMIAPMLGGWMAQTWSWRVIFWFLAVAVAAVVLASFRRMPETLPASYRVPLQPLRVLRGYGQVLTHRLAMTYALASAGIMAVFFVYVAATPFLYMQVFGLSIPQYSLLFGTGAGLALLGNSLNIQLVARFGYRHVLLGLGMAVMTLGAVLFAGCFGLFGRWAIYVPGLLFMPLLHMVGANAITGAMDQFETGKGIASALFLSLRFGIGMVAVAVVGSFDGAQQLQYGLITFVFAAISGIAAQMAVRWDKAE